MNQLPTYFAYAWREMTQDYAYERAKKILYHDSVIYVRGGTALGRQFPEGSTPKALLPFTKLVRVDADGTQTVIDERFN